jgi:hypothetical protein
MMPVLTDDQIAAVARAAGFPAGPAVYAVAITHPESDADSDAVQQGEPYAETGWGLWQITPGDSVPQFGIDNQLLVPISNARAAHAKWAAAGGFSPWTTYENGLEEPYLAAAQAAVARVYHMSAGQLASLVRQAGAGGTVGGPGISAAEDWSAQVRTSAKSLTGAARHLHNHANRIERLHTHSEH